MFRRPKIHPLAMAQSAANTSANLILVVTVAASPILWIARIKGFPYYGHMNITLSLDDKLVKEVRKIAVEQDTTLAGLVRAYLEQLAQEHAFHLVYRIRRVAHEYYALSRRQAC